MARSLDTGSFANSPYTSHKAPTEGRGEGGGDKTTLRKLVDWDWWGRKLLKSIRGLAADLPQLHMGSSSESNNSVPCQSSLHISHLSAGIKT